jgi:hypothetical protein
MPHVPGRWGSPSVARPLLIPTSPFCESTLSTFVSDFVFERCFCPSHGPNRTPRVQYPETPILNIPPMVQESLPTCSVGNQEESGEPKPVPPLTGNDTVAEGSECRTNLQKEKGTESGASTPLVPNESQVNKSDQPIVIPAGLHSPSPPRLQPEASSSSTVAAATQLLPTAQSLTSSSSSSLPNELSSSTSPPPAPPPLPPPLPSRPQSYTFEFRLGEAKRLSFIGLATLTPFVKTPLSQEILNMRSFHWTKILTKEKFDKAQLDFRGGFSNPKLACVLSVNIPRSLVQNLDSFRRDALACLLEGWEFLMLIHRSHYLHSILVQECSDDSQGSSNIDLLSKSTYFLLGFSKGWRQNQKKSPPPSISTTSSASVSSNPPWRKSVKPQEISRSNYIIKDFGKAKILKPISASSAPTTTPAIMGRPHERKDHVLLNAVQTTSMTPLQSSGPSSSQRVEDLTEPLTRGSHLPTSSNPNTAFTSNPSSSNPPLRTQLPNSHMATSWVPRMNTSHLLDHGISELTSVPTDPHRKSL